MWALSPSVGFTVEWECSARAKVAASVTYFPFLHLYVHLVQGGANAMHAAAQGGNLEMVKFFSSMLGAKVHEKTRNGWTSLHNAAVKGHCQVARYLIEELKFDPKDKDKVCVVLERRSCGYSVASVYVLIVAN